MFQIIECHASYGPYAPLGALWDSVRHPVRHSRTLICHTQVENTSIPPPRHRILDFDMSELLLSRYFPVLFQILNAIITVHMRPWDALCSLDTLLDPTNAVTIMQEYAEYAQIWAYSTLKCHNFCSVEYFPVIVSDY